tara:strand:- start:85 stop:822 length:738 start_codon:yes stop_codon:yes gene_type:complete
MNTINENLTTLTVTYNNKDELDRTLLSLLDVSCKPKKIIIIDGGSTDGSIDLIKNYQLDLPQIDLISEKDDGIFHAMNKGKKMLSTKLVHYLTAGDFLNGDPYKDIDSPCLLPVVFIDENGEKCGKDQIKLFGTQYNHQGMILPSDHNDYDTSLWIGADYKMSLEAYPMGLNRNMFKNNGSVTYQLGGLSSQKTTLGRIHMLIGIFKVRPLLAIPVSFAIIFKNLIPRRIRRLLLKHEVMNNFRI